jgi:hypothetical protein
MRLIQFREPGPPSVLQCLDVPIPDPSGAQSSWPNSRRSAETSLSSFPSLTEAALKHENLKAAIGIELYRGSRSPLL